MGHRKKKLLIKLLLGLVISGIGIALTFYWYDWKLFVVILLLLMGNNIGQSKN